MALYFLWSYKRKLSYLWYTSQSKEAIPMIQLRERLRELSTLTLPLLVEHTFITLMGMVNTAMIAFLGGEALAAAGHINNASQIPIALFAAMTTGGTIVVAQAVGARNLTKAGFAGGQAVALAAVFSVFLSLLLTFTQGPTIGWLFGDSDPAMIEAGFVYYGYINWSLPFLAIAQTLFGVMRGAGDVKNPMKITLFMNGVNIIFSYVLIMGLSVPFIPVNIPSLGMHGAGLAIAIARLAGMICAIWVIMSKKSPIRLNKLMWYKPTKSIQKDILTLGVPTGIENLLFQIGRLTTQMMIIGMGTAIMAANIVATNMMGFIMIPGNALTISLMVMVGQRVGRRDIDDISKTAFFASGVAAVFMGLMSLILLPMSGLLGAMFSLDAESTVYFRQLLIVLLIVGPFLWPLSFVIPSALRAVNDVKFTMVISVSTMWLFRIGLGYFLGITLGLGVAGVWLGIYGDWASRSILFYIRLRRKKWMKKLEGDAL